MAVKGDRRPILPPTSGLIAMRIGQEFGPPEQFAQSLERALARGADRGATLVAVLDPITVETIAALAPALALFAS